MPDRNNYNTFQTLLSQILAHNLQQQQMQQQQRMVNPMMDRLLSSHYGNQGTPLPFGNQPLTGRAFAGQYGLSPSFIQLMDLFRQGRMGMGMNAAAGGPQRQLTQTQHPRGGGLRMGAMGGF